MSQDSGACQLHSCIEHPVLAQKISHSTRMLVNMLTTTLPEITILGGCVIISADHLHAVVK
jgi:hypothetical protein